MLSVPGPPPPPWYPPPPPGPRPPGLLQRSRTTGTNPRKPEGGRTMENDPSQCFFTGAENRIRAGTGAPFARRKEQHHILYGNERNDDITANKRQQPYHISVEHTAPHRRGGANQNDHKPHPTGGGGDKVTMTLLLTSVSNHINTSVEHTVPPQAGRGQPKRPQAPLHRGEGTRPKLDQTGKATRPHLTGHGVGGGEGGCGSPASYILSLWN